ncbi:hypothetical protein LWI29_034860 [Acer saccharum]|uniref:RNase H type-1 domain-containing protein n=1 Tax=Acer saccharum TaxID=4024 RepID=A0AA39SZ98_ACESA|nr:hypothetical protein LWI29_034860 [Acer saccharum]
MAIYKGISTGRDMGLENFVVESDAETVIKQIGKGDHSEASYGGILAAVQNIKADARNVSLHHVSTKANRVALALAKEALSISNMVKWKEDLLLCIRDMVEDYKVGFYWTKVRKCCVGTRCYIVLSKKTTANVGYGSTEALVYEQQNFHVVCAGTEQSKNLMASGIIDYLKKLSDILYCF